MCLSRSVKPQFIVDFSKKQARSEIQSMKSWFHRGNCETICVHVSLWMYVNLFVYVHLFLPNKYLWLHLPAPLLFSSRNIHSLHWFKSRAFWKLSRCGQMWRVVWSYIPVLFKIIYMACLILYPPHLLHFVDSHSLCFTNFWAGKECKYSEFVTFFSPDFYYYLLRIAITISIYFYYLFI